jgi:glycosyltransferase involved in cell wall biosynthesis
MDVVFDHHAFCLQRVGGISRYFCELGARIARVEGVRARVLAPAHRNALLARCEGLVEGRYLPLPQGAYGPLMAFDFVATRLGPSRGPARAVVHETFYGWTAGNAVRGPRVTTVHDMIHELFRGQFGLADSTVSRKRRSIARADRVLCVSETTRRDLLARVAIAPERVAVVHHGCTLAPPGALPPGVADRPFVLYVGAREGYKNFSGLLGAWSASARLSRDGRIVAFGGGPLRASERREAARHGLDPTRLVHAHGGDETLSALYRAARATVVPSLYEGFGLPVLEAMQAGCPVAIADRGALPEVADGAAEAFDPRDTGSMRAALERVFYDEPARAALVARGTARARAFSWDRCATETLAHYRALW